MIDFTKTCATCFRAKWKCLCASPDSVNAPEAAREHLVHNDEGTIIGSIASRAPDIITLDVISPQAEITAVCEGIQLRTRIVDAERGLVAVEGPGLSDLAAKNSTFYSTMLGTPYYADQPTPTQYIPTTLPYPNSLRHQENPENFSWCGSLNTYGRRLTNEELKELTFNVNEELKEVTFNAPIVPTSTTISQQFNDPEYGLSTLQLTQTAESVTVAYLHEGVGKEFEFTLQEWEILQKLQRMLATSK